MLSWLRRNQRPDSILGLAVHDDRLNLAQLAFDSGEPYLRACTSLALNDRPAKDILPACIAENQWQDMSCNAVLSPRDYNLYLIEAPAVEESELVRAVRWKVKDLLDVPSEDAAIDVFPVPEDAFPGRARMLYVVAAQRSRVQQLVDMAREADLALNAIDIPELAMRNLSRRYVDDSNGLALMALKKGGSSLNLTRRGDLYLTRKINTQVEENAIHSDQWDALRDRLVLEVQRSLDYYESQMRQNPVSRLLLAPRGDDDEALAASLNEAMAVEVGLFDYTGDLARAEDVDIGDMRAGVMAIGAALRPDEASAEGSGS